MAVSIPGRADVAQLDAAVHKGPIQLERAAPAVPLPAAVPTGVEQPGRAAAAPVGEQPLAAGAAGAGAAEIKAEPSEGGGEGVVVKREEQEGGAQQGGREAAGPAAAPAPGAFVPPPAPPEGSMARLLRTVRELGDAKAAVVPAAYATLFAIPGRPKLAFPPSRPYQPPWAPAPAAGQPQQQAAHEAQQRGASAPVQPAAQQAAAAPAAAAPRPAAPQPAGAQQAQQQESTSNYLDGFPRCKALMAKLRAGRPPGAGAARTPLQAVHEYASRLVLEVGGLCLAVRVAS